MTLRDRACVATGTHMMVPTSAPALGSRWGRFFGDSCLVLATSCHHLSQPARGMLGVGPWQHGSHWPGHGPATQTPDHPAWPCSILPPSRSHDTNLRPIAHPDPWNAPSTDHVIRRVAPEGSLRVRPGDGRPTQQLPRAGRAPWPDQAACLARFAIFAMVARLQPVTRWIDPQD
jgi:hypothetical protein